MNDIYATAASYVVQHLVIQQTAKLFVAEAAFETGRLLERVVSNMTQRIEILGRVIGTGLAAVFSELNVKDPVR